MSIEIWGLETSFSIKNDFKHIVNRFNTFQAALTARYFGVKMVLRQKFEDGQHQPRRVCETCIGDRVFSGALGELVCPADRG